jgi:hypothetical protein
MYGRHNPGASTARGCGLSVLPQPPKPPSWRDFDQRQNGVKNIDFTDLNRVHRSGQDLEFGRHHNHGHHAQSGHAKPAKRTKAKIHRTRSQVLIHQSEIPDVGVTVSPAETHPKEIGLRKKYYSDDRIYLDQNNERCKEWLAGVRACEPLEDVTFSQGTGVEVEVPEESSQWTNLENLRPPNSSGDSSSSESDPSDKGGGFVISDSKRSKHLEKVISPRQEHYRPSNVPSEDFEMGDSKIYEGIREVKVSPRSSSGKRGSMDCVTTRGGSPRSVCLSTTALGSHSADLPRVEVHTGLS